MAQPNLLNSESALDAAFDASHTTPVFVFKHSLVCPVSMAADREFASFVDVEASAARAGLFKIEIQNHRPLSQAVAERTGVRHESPQALLIVEGEVQWHASHGAITQSSLVAALDAVVG